MTEKILFLGKPREPYSPPLSPLKKTFFDVHMENISEDLREPLLRTMVDHGLAKDDPGLVFGMVFISIQKCVSEIPAQAEAAVHRASERAAEKMDEQSARLFNDHARMLEDHSTRLVMAADEMLKDLLVEHGAALEKRMLEGFERRLNDSLSKNSKQVAEDSSKAIRGALAKEVGDARKAVAEVRNEIEQLTESAKKAKAEFRWMPGWLLTILGLACLAIGWCARLQIAG